MRFLIAVIVLLCSLSSCSTPSGAKSEEVYEEEVSIDFDEIKKRGKLVVVTDYNSINYFIYKGTPMGYQLELLNAFCDNLDLELELIVDNDFENNLGDLRRGDVDLIAKNLTVTNDRSRLVTFTEPHAYARQVLIQRNDALIDEANSDSPFKETITNQLNLAGKTIYIPKGSAYKSRLNHLSDEIGDSINVVEIAHYEAEQLIGLVSEGEIDYTIADENVAKVNTNYYSNINIDMAISFPQKIAWAVRKSSPDLLSVLNNWIVRFKETRRYRYIYKKYFINRRSSHIVDNSFNSFKGGSFSRFDDIIKNEVNDFDWDWRLVASLIYQESRFEPEIESWAGAKGLMQLMPATAERFKVDDVYSPGENIRGGVELLKWLDKRMAIRIQDPVERQKFVLASYNVGIGHVLDAMRLAEKYKKNPKLWTDNVDFYLLNKSNPKYFKDPIVQFGYCRGAEPYMYVKEIIERYEHYKNLVD